MQYIQFRALAEGHLIPAEYHESAVSSVYYDTPDDVLINRSINGGKYKEKLRVRSYETGGLLPDSPVFIEIKKKFKGITYKRRVNCSQAAADAFLAGMDYEQAMTTWPLADPQAQECALSRTSMQVAGEIAWMRDHYAGFCPKMRVSTQRLSYIDADDSELRITFDADVRWNRACEEGVEHSMFSDGTRILEVKCARSYPMWLVAVLNECDARPQSVSKYGRAYQAAMTATQARSLSATRKRMALEPARNSAPNSAQTAAPVHASRKRGFAATVKAGLAPIGLPFNRKPAHAAQR